MTNQARLDERYGTSPRNKRKVTLTLWLAAVFAAIVLVLWIAFAGLGGTSGTLEERTLGYDQVDDSLLTVNFEVTAPRNTPVSCTVEAMNEKFATVGWKIVDLPASSERTRTFSEPLHTTEMAVTGLLGTCWLP